MICGIFRSRLREAQAQPGSAYEPVAERMEELARSMPGFRSVKTFAAEDGERATLFEFERLADVDAWRDQAEHQEAQAQGRAEFYASYDLIICESIREAHFRAHD